MIGTLMGRSEEREWGRIMGEVMGKDESEEMGKDNGVVMGTFEGRNREGMIGRDE